ncbi:MAG: TraR/DksA family transcriptional regulator [Actinomycetota bacterium]
MDALDDAMRQRLRDELLRHRTFLRAEIGSQGADPDSDDVAFVDDGGFADRGHRTGERSQVIAVVRALRSNLHDVQGALAKLDAGTYGICEGCGNRISLERLEALPWALLCIDCKQRAGAR